MRKLLLTISFLLICSTAWSAQFLFKTVKPSGGDYTSLEAALDANEQNLTGDGWFDLEISGDWDGAPDTTQVSLGGYTTTSVDYINIYTTGDARHKGVYDTAYYILIVASGDSMNISDSWWTIDGLQFKHNKVSGVKQIDMSSFHVGVFILNNIFNGDKTTGSSSIAIELSQPRGDWHIRNNIAFDYLGNFSGFTRYPGTNEGDSGTTMNYSNNTIWNCRDGFQPSKLSGGFCIVKNMLVMKGDNVSWINHAGISSGSNNATYDGLGDDSPLTSGLVNKTAYSDYFVDTTSSIVNLHLFSAGTIFEDTGVDLSGDFTKDIDGETRVNWDIGADEGLATCVAPFVGWCTTRSTCIAISGLWVAGVCINDVTYQYFPLANTDTCEENITTPSTPGCTSSDLELGADGTTEQDVAVRFGNVNFGQGAIIATATVSFFQDQGQTETISTLISAHDHDNSPAIDTGTSQDISDRTRTTANVTWSHEDWNLEHKKYTSPDITDIIQEISDRGSFASDRLTIIIDHIETNVTREAESNLSEFYPVLDITFSSDPAVGGEKHQQIIISKLNKERWNVKDFFDGMPNLIFVGM